MSKGESTRERIIERAFLLAGRDGLNGLSLGSLSDALNMSKSGLFAHFGSKEELQVAVLKHAADTFTEQVIKPALKAPRGLPRLEAMFNHWLEWGTDPKMPGGCLFPQASAELDDHWGAPRSVLVSSQQALLATIARAARLCVEEGHFRSGLDTEQFAFEAQGLILGFHHSFRLLRDPKAMKRARAAFARLLDSAKP
ncbi:MAG: TetR/AcrR family transcriptional regulator [Myxococcaceae bacterium]|nr:TetR/AcrR family transcriptional regulator [Myxococcaceae bacterium]